MIRGVEEMSKEVISESINGYNYEVTVEKSGNKCTYIVKNIPLVNSGDFYQFDLAEYEDYVRVDIITKHANDSFIKQQMPEHYIPRIIHHYGKPFRSNAIDSSSKFPLDEEDVKEWRRLKEISGLQIEWLGNHFCWY